MADELEGPRGDPKDRILAAGARLMATKGYEGASVREICDLAGVSNNMVHHYFGSKQGLFDTIVEQFGSGVFAVPLRIIDQPPATFDDFLARLQLLFDTTLEAYIEHRDLFLVVHREDADPAELPRFMRAFSSFLDQAKERGFVRQDVDADMITGFLLDRILNQVQLAPWIARNHGVDLLGDAEYRTRWARANLDIFVHGVATTPPG